jgi:glycosyltransferase involved in cell wall biosynthesis
MPKSNDPLITICIPTYNRANFIGNAINSILKQTYKNFELLICNDCSTDNTEEVIKKFKDKRITYIKNQKNSGYIYSMNKCTKMAKGDWVMHLSDDDELLPDTLELQVKALQENADKTIGFVVPQTMTVNPEGKTVSVPQKQLEKNKWYIVFEPKEFIPNYTLYGKKIRDKYVFGTSFPSTLFNKKVLLELGMSSVEVPVAHDLLIGAKICLKYPVIVIDKPLIKYMVHENWGSSLNARGEFLREEAKYFELLLDFVKQEKITFDYDFRKYCYQSLVDYLFRVNGGLIRLAARYNGSFANKMNVRNEYIKFGLKHDKGLLSRPTFYAVVLASFLPKGIILKFGKMYKQI